MKIRWKCPECGRVIDGARKPRLCKPCYKRLVWRPRGGPGLERDREASRRWKREHLGQPGQPRQQ